MALSIFKSIFFKSPLNKELSGSIHNIFGFYPGNIHLYKIALSSRSGPSRYSSDSDINNERLEYLGDAVLGSVIADYLYRRFPMKPEGFLTEMRSKIVSRSNLNVLSRKMGIDHLLSNGNDSRIKSKSIYGDTFEALIGAIYLDKGYNFTRKVILKRILDYYLDIDMIERTEVNFKSKLIEWGQKEKKSIEFVILNEIGDAQHRQYLVEVTIDSVVYGRAQDYSIKGAEKRAAELTWEKLFPED